MDIKQIVLDLCTMNDEQEWFEFKENWFQPETFRRVMFPRYQTLQRSIIRNMLILYGELRMRIIK